MKLTPKQRLTIFTISDWMAHTMKHEVEVVSVLDTPQPKLRYVNGPLEGYRLGTFRIRGKRKTFFLDVKSQDLVFDGWDFPLIADSEIVRDNCTRFSGNACFNFGIRETPGDPPAPSREHEALLARSIIEALNLNLPLTDDTKGKCILCRAGDGIDNDGELLWPEIEVAHAVVNRMKEKLSPELEEAK
jgi:hypothetical protein